MNKKALSLLLGVSSALLLSGCVVRTYPLTKDRIDQDLTSGNRGFVQGKGAQQENERPSTRTTQVVEIELNSPIKFEKRAKLNVREAAPAVQKQEEPAAEGNKGYITKSETPEIAESANTQKYTVQRGDTLQKISKKFYGTSKRWKKIYNANKGVLKTANSIRPGQVINVPTEGLKEGKESKVNLK
jgi:nucleoid-associated protein YgaU